MNSDSPPLPPQFSVGPIYSSTNDAYVTSDLAGALAHAAAFAMHTGQTFGIRVGGKDMIVSVSPSTIDWRRVNATHMLAVKAMAHELVPNVDLVVPSMDKEGILS